MDAESLRCPLRLTGRPPAVTAVVAMIATCGLPATTFAAEADRSSWLGAPLDYLLHTGDEFPPITALYLRAAGQATANPIAVEVAAIRRLELNDEKIGALAPFFESDLEVLPPLESTAAAQPRQDGSRAASRIPLPGPRLAPPLSRDCLARIARCDSDLACTPTIDEDKPRRPATEVALWLLYSFWSGCIAPSDASPLAARIAGELERELESDSTYSPENLLRMAMLGHLGAARWIDPQWVRAILEARTPDGCWGDRAGGDRNPYATALALWALALAERANRWPE